MPYEFATQCIHAGQPNEAVTGAVTYPIFQTSTFAEEEPGVPHNGFCYSRTNNPTRQALEENVAALEGARYGIAFASGLAAVNDVLNLLRSGDHVIAGRDLYGGSYRLFTKLYAKFGVTFSFVDTTDVSEIERHIHTKTKLLWLESPSNPLLAITDIAAASALAHDRGIITVVDNTFATPVLQRPLELGADIVLHSTTKYLNGHADVIGGCVVTNNDELAKDLRFFQNAVGAVPGPQDCFLVLRGIKTLPLRVERHCETARAIAEFLDGHEAIAKVHFPGLSTHPGHELAKRQMRDFGAVISFELKGGFEAARTFAASTKLFTLAESLGAVKSLLCHPATMTHASVEPEVRLARGINDGLIRLSVGIEDVRDLIADLEQALRIAANVPEKAEEVAA
jgi:cystathionine beta-lyase/cystathionine gamma-synthase